MDNILVEFRSHPASLRILFPQTVAQFTKTSHPNDAIQPFLSSQSRPKSTSIFSHHLLRDSVILPPSVLLFDPNQNRQSSFEQLLFRRKGTILDARRDFSIRFRFQFTSEGNLPSIDDTPVKVVRSQVKRLSGISQFQFHSGNLVRKTGRIQIAPSVNVDSSAVEKFSRILRCFQRKETLPSTDDLTVDEVYVEPRYAARKIRNYSSS